jgi:MFS transporter, DHA2 family, multidrug resistance protein
VAKGYEPATATNSAYAQLKLLVRREAYVMAFNDAFLVVMVALLIGAFLVWFCHGQRKPVAARRSNESDL